MGARKLEFRGHDGSLLAARLDLPAGPPRAYALFAHCFTCGKDVLAAARIGTALAQHGIAVLRFDFTGLGASAGDFANTNFSSNVADLVLAADHLRAHHQAPALLVGHSLGGAAVLAAAASIPEARAVATIGAPSEPVHVLRHLGAQVDTIEAEGQAEVELGGQTFRVERQLLEDLKATRLSAHIAGLRRALMVMHAPGDTVVDIDHARRIYEAARHPKSFVTLDDAEHMLVRREDAMYAASVLAAWAERYLPAATTEEVPAQVDVAESGGGRYTTLVRAGRHMLLADEPAALGGDDAGPDPYAWLLAALGTCTSMTLRMYAERKGLALERVAVSLSHRRVHAKDCEDCDQTPRKLSEITRHIRLDGDLDAAQRTRLLEIADRCPVHRTLSEEIRIVSELVPDQQRDAP